MPDYPSVKEIFFNRLPPDLLGKICGSKNLVIFGAAMNGKFTLEYLTERGIHVTAFCDNSIHMQGKTICGKPCFSFEDIKKIDDVFVIVAITRKSNLLAVCGQLSEAGLNFVSFRALISALNQPELQEVMDSLRDDMSKRVFTTLLCAGADNDYDSISAVCSPDQYFCIPQLFDESNSGSFVDCGAYVGDSLEQILWKVQPAPERIYAFEPGAVQFKALEFRRERLLREWALKPDQIVCVQAGAGCQDGSMELDTSVGLSSAHLSSESSNANTVSIRSLDSFLRDEKVAFIKADVEGAELDLLRGAEGIIRQQKPSLAICIYHRASDYFIIPKYIRSLVPEYKMAIRHHTIAMTETVLYCWTK